MHDRLLDNALEATTALAELDVGQRAVAVAAARLRKALRRDHPATKAAEIALKHARLAHAKLEIAVRALSRATRLSQESK